MLTTSDFLHEFEQASAIQDASRTAALFAECFLSASAEGVRALTPADLVRGIPLRRAMLARVGLGPGRLLQHHEHDIDAHYVLLNSTWSWEVQRSDAEPVAIVLTSTFVLHRAPLGLQEVFYKSGDIVGELRSRGLLEG